MPRPHNIIEVRNLTRAPTEFRLHSRAWGINRTTPLPFDDRWQRLRAAGREQGLSRAARTRLEWFLWYQQRGGNARATCRHFGIAPKVFYHWRKRFNVKNLLSLEDRSRR